MMNLRNNKRSKANSILRTICVRTNENVLNGSYLSVLLLNGLV